MIEINSLTNQTVKDTVRLHQKKYRGDLIILEGIKALDGAIEAKLEITHIFSSDKNLLNKYSKYPLYLADDKVMEKISTTQSAPLIFAIAKKPQYNLENFKTFKKIALIDGIKDSGNLGTIIRSAVALGIEGILLFGDSTDEFSPKTIRSAAGNIFKIPILEILPEKLIDFKKTHTFIATVVNANDSIENLKNTNPVIVMLGSEASGLCEELLNLKDKSVTLPMQNSVESLNIAVCAGIIFFIMQNI